MRRIMLSSLAIAAVLLASCGPETVLEPSPSPGDALLQRAAAAGPTWDFTEIHVPGSVGTFPFGIAPGGDVVGSYLDPVARRERGFLLRQGVFTPIDFPGARYTVARGINPRGDIVGDYAMPGEAPVHAHGFLLTVEGTFVKVDDPPHTSTIAQRILPDGTILGCRHNTDRMSTMRGILLGRDGRQELDEFGSMHNGATPDGRFIVGLYMNMMVMPAGRTEGYVLEDGEFRPFIFPGSNFTQAWDVNPRREIVGVYRTGGGTPSNPFVLHGFLRRGEDYSTIDYPGATATRAFGINPAGDVVGWYTVGTGPTAVTRGFLATSRGNRGGNDE